MAFLEMLAGTTPGKKYRLDSPKAILGRHPDCDIVLDAGAVSRQHAQITQTDNGGFLVEDLDSRNGTFVNNEQITGPYLLQEGDRLKICDLMFRFSEEKPRIGGNLLDGSFSGTLMMDDDSEGGSQIMSQLSVSQGSEDFRINVNCEVKLRALLEISHKLSRSLSLDDVLPKLIDSLFKIFPQADRGQIVLTAADGTLIPKVVRHRNPDAEDSMRISRTILKQVMEGKQAILSADAVSDQRFEMSQSIADFRIRSMMCVPLINSDDEAFGVIQIDTGDQRSRFMQDDLDVLAAVASQAAFAIDNAQLHEQALQQHAIQRDLELAHKVQRGLLPIKPPEVPGYYFFDFYEAANQVGGDFYDYIPLGEDKIAVVLADVSGKGVSAALVMAKLSAEVRYNLASEPVPCKAMQRINASFCQSGWDDRFVTMILAVLDRVQHKVTIVNAGHMPPFLRCGDGAVIAISGEQAGLPLGVYDDFEYEQSTYDLDRNSFISIFTDGISEAMNINSDLYGLDRLSEQMGAGFTDVMSMGQNILNDVKCFVGGRSQSDDICLVCLGRGST